MRVIIQCTQKFTFKQDIEVTDEEYALLKHSEGEDISEYHTPHLYGMIDGKLDFRDVLEAEPEFTDFSIQPLPS